MIEIQLFEVSNEQFRDIVFWCDEHISSRVMQKTVMSDENFPYDDWATPWRDYLLKYPDGVLEIDVRELTLYIENEEDAALFILKWC